MHRLSTARFLGAFSLAALAAASLCACDGDPGQSAGGGGSGGSGAGGSGGGAAGSHAVDYAAAVCGKVFECCNTADIGVLFNPGGFNVSVVDYAGCRILYRTTWDTLLEPILQQGMAAGRLELDEAKFDACLDAFAAQPCNGLSLSTSLCPDVFIPKVEAGGACASGLECKTGACEVPDGAAEGTCVDKPLVALGGDCKSTDDCEPALYCEAGKCASTKADGQDCGAKEECQSQACVGQSQGTGKCDTICQGGGPGPGPIDETLEPVAAQLARATCSRIFECCDPAEREELLLGGIGTEAACLAFYGAFGGLAMVGVHNSAVQGKVSVDGQGLKACLEAYDSQSCADFSTGADLACTAAITGLVANGQPCAQDVECTSTYCNQSMGGDGTCAALPGAGAPCSGDCAKGFHCAAGTCAPQKATGDACTTDAACAEGICHGPDGGPETCSLICDGT